MVRIYNQWVGNPEGTPENPLLCIAASLKGITLPQCCRRRNWSVVLEEGQEPRLVKKFPGLYCYTHAVMIASGSEGIYIPSDDF